MSVFQCPACPVAPINLKTHLGSPWYSRNTRRKKPLPHPLPDRQQSQIQALCPLSKGRTLDPAHPLHLPTHSMKMMMGTKATQWKRRGMEDLPSQQQLWLVTPGTASHRQLKPQGLTPPRVPQACLVLPVLGEPRARRGQHHVLRSPLQVPKTLLQPAISMSYTLPQHAHYNYCVVCEFKMFLFLTYIVAVLMSIFKIETIVKLYINMCVC